MKKALILLVVLALAGGASAEIKTWVGALFGNVTDEWVVGSSDQWADPAATPISDPNAIDYAVILDDEYVGMSLLPYPVIRTDVGTVSYLGVNLHSDATAVLTIETGGRLVVTNRTTLAGDEAGLGNSFGTINFDGGTLITGELYAGTNTGVAQINLNAGTLHAGTVTFGTSVNVDLEVGPYFHINGDVTPFLQLFVDNGQLSSSDGDGTTHLEWDYGVTAAGLTSIYAVEGLACSSYLVSDINGDCVTDFDDLIILASEWLSSGL